MTISHIHWQIPPNNTLDTQGENDLHQCIYNILSTHKGSDVLRPEFGSNHFDYIDQPFDIAIPNIVREIFIALQKWEKRIEVQKVDVSGTAPQYHLRIYWQVVEDLSRQIYTTEI